MYFLFKAAQMNYFLCIVNVIPKIGHKAYLNRFQKQISLNNSESTGNKIAYNIQVFVQKFQFF